MSSTIIHNVKVFFGDVPKDALVSIHNKRIISVQPREEMSQWPSVDSKIDGNGQLLIPGMIDVHIHGADGYDMMDGKTESVGAVSKACARTGCTSFLATSVSSSLQDLLTMVNKVKHSQGREPGARIAGMHIEGPYLNVKRKGMQKEGHLRHPDLEEMETILNEAEGLIRMVTLAPELPGGIEMIHFLKTREIIPAIAHSDATYEQALEAFHEGATHVTHCCNGMRPMHHRDPGLVMAAFEQEKVSVQAIVDNIHLHPAMVRLIHREKGADKTVLITDALQAMGLGDGTYTFGGHQVQVKNGVATLADGTLASSTVTMNEALKNAVDAGIPLHDAIQMATQTPADILGMTEKGRVAAGCDADLVLLDENFQVVWTMVEGDVVYKSHADSLTVK
ncbi:N-acetylglucosamine-6-phosphate deacetylase [Thalassobacillus pellis]|uniref:N-acetylglucosamine-6-phosphate deacetylase n=1 Tax=Thalassobacillus pellis TaxID=748008 RepID=UPI001EF8A16B|nr:N-acetylglucosamine-6-phosphate deacetylase [Thalassobacillus pellis]MBM7553133.1 N-acetylglucosamine-6-phosphate deacetylase [Thalassobacillus pellis]